MTRQAIALASLLIIIVTVTPATADRPFVSERAVEGNHWYTDLAIDSKGRPHIVYWDVSNFWMSYAYKEDGVWNTEIIAANGFVGNEVSIAIDSQDEPHVIWHNFVIGGQSLLYSERAGGVWSGPETVVTDPAMIGRYNDLALDSNDIPHIVFRDDNDDLFHGERNGAWSTLVLVLDSDFNTAIAVNSIDQPQIAYTSGGDIGWLARDGGIWTGDTVGLQFVIHVEDLDLAIGPQGNPVIAYYYEDILNQTWMYLAQRGTSWNTESVEPTGDHGRYVSLALDSDAKAHISAYSGSFDDLWYHEQENDTTFTRQVVDHVGDTGLYTSLAPRPLRQPRHLLYQRRLRRPFVHRLGHSFAERSGRDNLACRRRAHRRVERLGRSRYRHLDRRRRDLQSDRVEHHRRRGPNGRQPYVHGAAHPVSLLQSPDHARAPAIGRRE